MEILISELFEYHSCLLQWILEEPICPDRPMSFQTGIILDASSTTRPGCLQREYHRWGLCSLCSSCIYSWMHFTAQKILLCFNAKGLPAKWSQRAERVNLNKWTAMSWVIRLSKNWLLNKRHPWVFRSKRKARLSGLWAGERSGLAQLSLSCRSGRSRSDKHSRIYSFIHQCSIIYANTISAGDEYFHVVQGFSFCCICSFLLRGFVLHWRIANWNDLVQIRLCSMAWFSWKQIFSLVSSTNYSQGRR